MPYFPIFTDISDKSILVIGGGKIAARRITALAPFCKNIMVISPSLTKELEALLNAGSIDCQKRVYEPGDCEGYDMILAACPSREVNHAVYLEASEFSSFINICDCKEECNFYFPGIAIHGDFVAGVTASGTNHSLTKELTNKIQGVLDHV